MRVPLAPTLCTAAVLLASPVHGATGLVLPPGGGLGALAIDVDVPGRTLRYKSCAALPCVADAAASSVPIALEPTEMPEPGRVVVESVPIGLGRAVAHVLLPSRSGQESGWEAILASGKSPIFAERTGFVHGEEGERSGPLVRFVEDGPTRHVVIGQTREDLRICGQVTTILSPAALEASTLLLRGSTVQRLPAKQRESARRIVASARGGPADAALAPLLVASGASTAIGLPQALTDGDIATTWSEARPGIGQGEFVMIAAPHEVPIERLSLVVAPPSPKPEGAAPRELFLVSDAETYRITLPEDGWMHPGAAYDIALPEPVRTSCLALVLGDQAYDHDRPHPEVTIAELYAYSAFDAPGASLDAAAKALKGGGPRAEAAAGVLSRAGAKGFAAMAAAYDGLDAAGRALAIHVAASGASCEESASLLVRGMTDPDREVRRKARTKLENPECGRASVPALIRALGQPERRTEIAPLLAAIAHDAALEPIGRWLGEGDASTRNAIRDAFGHAARTAKAEALVALVDDTKRPPGARLELLRALHERLTDTAPQADRAIVELIGGDAPMRFRYLASEPLSLLALAGDEAARGRLILLATKDPEWPVRAHAIEGLAGTTGAADRLAAACEDPNPRVRDSALRALALTRVDRAPPQVFSALSSDPWTFVRVSAATALARMPPSEDVDRALGRAMGDASGRVRATAIESAGTRGVRSLSDDIRRRLLDETEDVPVREAAARALGQLCDVRALSALTDMARASAGALPTEALTELSLAAIEALADLHPNDLSSRLGPLRSKGTSGAIKEAGARALAGPGRCR